MARKTSEKKAQIRQSLASMEDFFGFEEVPFNPKDFVMVQTDIFQKVERALLAMEEDLHGKEPAEKELLMSVMKVPAWRNLRECLGASIQNIENRRDLEKYIYECATIFYKELDHPYWSTTQFQYLLHLNPHHPEYWAGYGICMVEMQERGVWEEFMLEEKAALAFKRAARLSIAHILKGTYLGEQKLLEHALRYYENAHALNPEPEADEGIHLVKKIKKEKDLLTRKEMEKLDEFQTEIRAILSIIK